MSEHRIGDIVMEWGTGVLGYIASYDKLQDEYCISWIIDGYPEGQYYTAQFVNNTKLNLKEWHDGKHREWTTQDR